MFVYVLILGAAAALVVGWVGERTAVLVCAVLAAAGALAALGLDEWLRRGGTLRELALLDLGRTARRTSDASPDLEGDAPSPEA